MSETEDVMVNKWGREVEREKARKPTTKHNQKWHLTI